MFGFVEFDSPAALIGEFMFAVAFIAAILFIARIVNARSTPPGTTTTTATTTTTTGREPVRTSAPTRSDERPDREPIGAASAGDIDQASPGKHTG